MRTAAQRHKRVSAGTPTKVERPAGQPGSTPLKMDHTAAAQLFYRSVGGRKANDANNRVREKVMLGFFNGDPVYNDPAYSAIKANFNAWLPGWKNEVGLSSDTPLHVEKVGGRKNSDFSITTSDKTIRPEFKFGAKTICAAPQFLSVAANRDWHQGEYCAIYYYDNYLPQVCAIYGITHTMSKEEYIARVHNESYDQPLFAALKKGDVEGTAAQKAQKKKLVDQSIREWLDMVKDKTDLAVINEVLSSSQKAKKYILCKGGEFYSDEIEPDELIALKVVGIHLGKNLVIQTQKPTTRIHMLLRWKNHAGVCLPAWQLKLRREKAPAKKRPPKKSPAKKSPAKKSTAKKSTAK